MIIDNKVVLLSGNIQLTRFEDVSALITSILGDSDDLVCYGLSTSELAVSEKRYQDEVRQIYNY